MINGIIFLLNNHEKFKVMTSRVCQDRDRLAAEFHRVGLDACDGASSQRVHSSARIHLLTPMSSRRRLEASRTRSSISISSCPCAHCPPLIPSTEPSSLFLACGIEVLALVPPVTRRDCNKINKNKFFY